MTAIRCLGCGHLWIDVPLPRVRDEHVDECDNPYFQWEPEKDERTAGVLETEVTFSSEVLDDE